MVAVAGTDAGLTVSDASAGLVVEEGQTGAYTIVLDSQPIADVTVTPRPAIANFSGRVTVDPQTLTFTSANWNQPQTVRATYEEDDIHESRNPIEGRIDHGLRSDDIAYNNLSSPPAKPLSLTDNDTRGVETSKTLVRVSEVGETTYTILLATEPIADTTVTPRSSDENVAGVDDIIPNPSNRRTIIRHGVGSNDNAYNHLDVTDVTVTVRDNETRPTNPPTLDVTVNSGAGLALPPREITIEEGTTFNYPIRLRTQPTANVIVASRSISPRDVSVSGSDLTFTPRNWDQVQNLRVTAVENNVVRGIPTDTIPWISHTVTSDDDDYDGVLSSNRFIRVIDNDIPNVTLSTTPVVVNDGGGTTTYQVRLATNPGPINREGGARHVTVRPTSSDPTVATVSGTLTFTPQNWDQPQDVTVTGGANRGRIAISHTISGTGFVSRVGTPIMVTVMGAHPGVHLSTDALNVNEAPSTAILTAPRSWSTRSPALSSTEASLRTW